MENQDPNHLLYPKFIDGDDDGWEEVEENQTPDEPEETTQVDDDEVIWDMTKD